MTCFRIFSLGLALATLPVIALSETTRMTMGGDEFVAGDRLSEQVDVPRDAFGAGATLAMNGTVANDAHLAGFDVEATVDTGGDLYVAGAMVTVSADVGSDLTAAGYTVHVTDESTVAGNLRAMGQTVTIDASVTGALSVAGENVILNGTVAGDAWITADQITFGPGARIDGALSYSSPDPVLVSEEVISPDRITSLPWTGRNYIDDFQRTFPGPEMPVFDTFISIVSAFLITLGFLLALGAIFLVFTPKSVTAMRREIIARPWHVVLLGIIGLAMLFGLIPVTALTILGLPFVPIGLLLIVVVWTLGYLLGAYAAAMRAYQAFGGTDDPALPVRLLVLTVGLIVVSLLNYIPYLGWVINYTLVLVGTGALTGAVLMRIVGPLSTATGEPMHPEQNNT